MHKRTSGNELVCSKHQDFCRADSRLTTGGSWGRSSLVPKKVGFFFMKVGRRGSWQPGMCLCKRQRAGLAPLTVTAHPAMLGTSKTHPFQCFVCVSTRAEDGSKPCRTALRPCPERKCGSQMVPHNHVPSRLESWAAPKTPAHWRLRPNNMGRRCGPGPRDLFEDTVGRFPKDR